MHVDEVIKKLGEHMEKVLEEDADAFNWDVKNKVVKDVVKFEKLGKIFSEEQIEEMEYYDLFAEGHNFDEAKKSAIVHSLIMSMLQYAEIEFPDDIEEWNPYEDGTLTLPKGVKFNK